MRIEYHRTLIADKARNAAFYAALKASIVPGETIVADIGTGTGLIGLLAAHLGAKRVYMYETAAVGEVAERIVRANKARVCELMACHSVEMLDPPHADVVVSETLGNYAFEENIISTLNDAVARHLKPGGRLIPSSVTQFVSPVVTSRIHDELRAWDDVGPALGVNSLDLSVAKAMSFNNVYVRKFAAEELLDAGRSALAWDTVEFARKPSSNRKGDARWRLDAQRSIFGFAVWWRATLAPGIDLATGPGDPPTHWEQLYFPIAQPLRCNAGDQLELSLRSRSSEEAGTHLAWTAVHLDGGAAKLSRQGHDLDKGYLP